MTFYWFLVKAVPLTLTLLLELTKLSSTLTGSLLAVMLKILLY